MQQLTFKETYPKGRIYPTCHDCFMSYRKFCIHPDVYYCQLCEQETYSPKGFTVLFKNMDYQVGTCKECK